MYYNKAFCAWIAKSLLLVTVQLFYLLEVISCQTIYPDDGSRNVIPVVRNSRAYSKPIKVIPYNDGTVMAHVIGSAGMNFLYFFHILGVSCENTDPEFYKIIHADFEFCLNKTGSLPPQLKNQPLGSIPKPCVDWKLRRPCFKNLADDYDECLVNRPGLVKKGTDALRFTHAYAKFICGNIADTEAHLSDRYHKQDLVVDGVFQCFPHLQDRIVNCVKRDKISKTLCSKFYIVHACFGKYYNDDNCQDVQPIYYMDDLFRNMSTNLNCPDPWGPEQGNDNHPTTPGWTEKPTKGWSSREHSRKENPWPGERGRYWPTTEREPYVRGEQRRPQKQFIKGESIWERGKGKGRVIVDTHAHRPLPDSHWNKRPSIEVVEGGLPGLGNSWERSRSNQVYTSSAARGPTPSIQFVTTRVKSGGSSSADTDKLYSRGTANNQYNRAQFSSTKGPRGITVGYAVTRSDQDIFDSGEKYYSTRPSPSLAYKTRTDDLGFNFYGF